MHEVLDARTQETCCAFVRLYLRVFALQKRELSTTSNARPRTTSLCVTSLRLALKAFRLRVHVLFTFTLPSFRETLAV